MITHDRWQRIKEIFQSAQERTPAERFDFLNEVCGDDQSIREEVEALLTADASNEDFLSAPAYEFAAGMLADEAAEFSAGQKVDRYEILCPLGSGGMGQIYLAHDEQLGRKIALKLIAREFATDPRRVLRFEQEARAASALNHPNVCVIHDVGVTENKRHFIAMEHIQGVTLRDKLAHEVITPLEALQIAGQVAAALAAAHAAGIVHRDIKPENIMLRPDGYVKVLDFGLAKLTEVLPDEPLGVKTNVWTINASTKVRTEAGTLMGTVKYMSPEQLREGEVDERTDIWSLGIVLYEMLTRTTPFEAKTPNGAIALIAGPQPAELSVSPELPIAYRDLIRKTLEKDRAKRYQSVTRLAADLNTLQKELEREFESGVVKPPLPSYPAGLNGQKTRDVFATSAFLTRMKSQALSTAEFIISEIRTHKTAALFTGATSVLLLLLLIPTASRFINNIADRSTAPTEPQVLKTKQTPFTNEGTSVTAAISGDGKLVAHAEQGFGTQRLILASTATFTTSVAVPARPGRYLGLTFSRDNTSLYFTRKEEHGPAILYRLPTSGTEPLRIKEGVDSPISFSPLGDQFAFVRFNESAGEYYLIISDTDGANERTLSTREHGDTFSTYGLAWAPDGSMIVCPAGRWDQGFHMDLIGVDVKSGEEKVLGTQSWFSVYQLAWPDMSGLVISAREREASPHQLWRIAYPEGVSQKITNDLNEYRVVSVSGDNIVTVRTDRTWRIWIATSGTLTPAEPIATGGGFSHGLTWSANGTLYYSSMAHGRFHISRVDTNGSHTLQLTNSGDNYNPAVTPDGRFIVFASKGQDGRFNIWRMNAEDGGGLQQLTFTDGNFYPAVSPDGQWVSYDNQTNLKLSIWKVSIKGGDPIKIADGYRMPAFSPNGQFIAGRYDRESGSRDVAIFSADGGEPLRHMPIRNMEWQRVQWLDDHTLSYIDSVNGASNIWSHDLDSSISKQLTHFDTDQIFAYAWSPDFKQVACQRVNNIGDVIIISSER